MHNASDAPGYLGRDSPNRQVFLALNRRRIRWTHDETLWLAGYAAQARPRTLGVAVPTIYDIAAKGLAALTDEELVHAAPIVHSLRRRADYWVNLDLENVRAAAVHRLREIIFRARLGPRDELPAYAFDWRDTLGPALKDNLAQVQPTAEVALSLELLNLRGNANTAPHRWIDLIAAELPVVGLAISRTIISTALDLPDDDAVVNHEGAPAFLGPDSLILLRAAVHVLLTQGDATDHKTLEALSLKCRAPIPEGWGHRRAPSVARDIAKGLIGRQSA